MFGKRFTLFRLFGVRVGVDFSWLLLAVLVTWTLAVSYFPYQLSGLDANVYWSMGALGALGLFVSIVSHEFAHTLVARRYGIPIESITLFLFGGVAKMDDQPASPKAEFLMAAAGPVFSFGLSLAFLVCQGILAGLGAPAAVSVVIAYLGFINAVLAVFNLIPAFPLDGGRMLRAALWGWKKDLRQATRIASGAGSGLGIALIVLGLFNVVTGSIVGGLWWFLIGLFVKNAAGVSYRQTMIRETLRGVPVRQLMTSDPISTVPTMTVAGLVNDRFYRHYHKVYPVVVKDERLVGCIALRDIKRMPRERWEDARVGEIMEACDRNNTIRPETDAVEALTRMNETGNSRLVVAENGRLAGMVSLKDLLRFLAMKLELKDEEKISRVPVGM